MPDPAGILDEEVVRGEPRELVISFARVMSPRAGAIIGTSSSSKAASSKPPGRGQWGRRVLSHFRLSFSE